MLSKKKYLDMLNIYNNDLLLNNLSENEEVEGILEDQEDNEEDMISAGHGDEDEDEAYEY